jgi:adenylate kinase
MAVDKETPAPAQSAQARSAANAPAAATPLQSGKAVAAPIKPLAIVLFGSPGSGKGTQSSYLVEWLQIPQISTGDMLRDHIRRGDEIGIGITDRMRAGSLVPDELVNELVRQRISEPDCDNGFILDGYPRTPAQAEEMLRLVAGRGAEEVVIHLVVDYNVIISRMTGRRVCPKCGTLYNSVSRPPKIDSICDLDGTSLVVREDDREEVVRRRLAEYERQTQPLIDFFRATSNRLIEVDASHDKPEEIFRKIRTALETVSSK